MDVLSEQQRRKTMQHIKGKDTKIEVQIARRKTMQHKSTVGKKDTGTGRTMTN